MWNWCTYTIMTKLYIECWSGKVHSKLESDPRCLGNTNHLLRLTSLYQALYRFRARLLASRKEEDRKGFGTARTIWDAILRVGRGLALSRDTPYIVYIASIHCCVLHLYCSAGASEVMALSLPIHFYTHFGERGAVRRGWNPRSSEC